MRFLVGVLLLAVVTSAVELKSRSKPKTESDTNTKTDKRALKEGNNGVEKRLAVLPTALPSGSPGIVYADAKDLADKSPVQQIYASPATPQIAKISDVLTGNSPSFPTAIASHLYSPVSIYQPRLATPTTYEVSAPVPSQLAYSEKISYQNPAQFTTQVLYNPQLQPQYFPKVNFPRFNAVQFQQAFQQQNPRSYTHPQTFQAQAHTSQLVLNQQPQYQNPQNVQNAQVVYSQVQQQLAQHAQTVQPQQGIVYARQEKEKDNPKLTQRELNLKPKVEQPAVQEKPAQSPNYKAQNQEAVSFASFFQGPPQQQQQYQLQQPQPQQYQVLQQPQQQQYQAIQQPQHQQYQLLQPQQQQYQLQQPHQQQYQLQQPQQQQYQLQQPQQQQYQLQQPQQQQYQQPQITQLQPELVQQYLIQVPQYQANQQAPEQNHGQIQTQNKSQLQPPSYQPQPQFQIQIPHYQPQAQIRYEPQFISKLESAPANSLPVPLKQEPARQVLYLGQPQYQPQVYQGVQQQGAPNVVQPAFPAVQYFGKFAQDIFGGLQQNH